MRIGVRADGGAAIGYGHLVRSNALGEVFLERGHDVAFASATPDAAREVCDGRVRVVPLEGEDDGDGFVRWLTDEAIDATIVDLYGIDTGYQGRIRDTSSRSILISDDDEEAVCADLVVNGNVYADRLNYRWVDSKPRFCLGTDFLLLREEVRTLVRQSGPKEGQPGRAIVTMGGSDVLGLTPSVMDAFAGLDIEVDVVVGPGFTNEAEIHRAANRLGARFHVYVTPEDLPGRMRAADLAVCAAGTTTYELLALGTPAIVVPVVENQLPIAQRLKELGAVRSVSPGDLESNLPDELLELVASKDSRERMRTTGQALVDGRGCERVYDAITELDTA